MSDSPVLTFPRLVYKAGVEAAATSAAEYATLLAAGYAEPVKAVPAKPAAVPEKK